ncbi:MAG: C39 family peptidase [Parcubacteria group bacterium]|jgi:peptidoglycan hydrolase CwlO-like protein
MEIKNKRKNRIYIVKLFILFVFAFIFYSPKFILADDSTSTTLTAEDQKKIDETNEELEKLNEKAATYEKLLLLKQKQKNLLGTQIDSLNSGISDIENKIKENSISLEELNKRNDELQTEILKNEVLIQNQRKILADIVRSYQENNENTLTKIIFNIESFSSIVKRDDYLSQTSDKILEITNNLKSLQVEIKKSQSELLKNRDALVEIKIKLSEENTNLRSAKIQKNTLLIQTQGDEATYQAKLDKIEKQKKQLLGDIDELYNANFAEISAFASKLSKPTSGLAETSWYYSQKDPRWGNETIGNSRSKMKDLGCAVSSVAMVFTYHGEHINPKQLSDRPIFSWDLINWPKTWDSLTLSSSTGHGGVSWSTIDKEIKNENPVIVFINAKNGAGHYVVIHHKANNGKYVVHDPYWGANIYLDSSMELLSKLYKVSVSKSAINQMIIYK